MPAGKAPAHGGGLCAFLRNLAQFKNAPSLHRVAKKHQKETQMSKTNKI
jgi:hypothetical protein